VCGFHLGQRLHARLAQAIVDPRAARTELADALLSVVLGRRVPDDRRPLLASGKVSTAARALLIDTANAGFRADC